MASRRLKVIQGHLDNSDLNIRLCSSTEPNATVFTDKEFKYTLNHNVLSPAQKKFYEQNGFIIKKGLVEEELLDACRTLAFSTVFSSSRFIDLCEGRIPKRNITLMKDISLAKKGATGQYLFNKAQDIHYDEVFEHYIFHTRLLDVVECFTGPNIKAIHTMLINKPPDSGSLTSRHPLHQDLYYFPFRPANLIVAAWTALEDVTVRNGCLKVIPGSHTRPLLQHAYPEWNGGVNKAYHGIKSYNENEVIPVEMKKGETIFFHPLLIHGSGSNKTNGFRKAISVHYAASDCYYIDVKGTIQENIAVEIEEMAKKMGFPIRIQDVWRLRSRLVRGEDRTL